MLFSRRKRGLKGKVLSSFENKPIYNYHQHFIFNLHLHLLYSIHFSLPQNIPVIATSSHDQFPKVSCINLFISHARTGKAYPSSGNENTEHRMAGLFRWGESRDGYKNIYLQVNAEATNDALLKWWQKSSRMPFTIERLYSMSQSIYPYAIASLAV